MHWHSRKANPLLALLLCGSLASCSCSGDRLVAAPSAKVSPSELDFGLVRVEQRATRVLTVTNEGNTALNVRLAGMPRAITASSPDFTLPAGASKDVKIIFAPDTEHVLDAPLFVSFGKELTVALKGRAVAQDVVTPTMLDFGVIPLGTARELSLEVRSICSCHLDVGIQLTHGDVDDFSLPLSQLEFDAPGSLAAQVAFAPRSLGVFNATVSVLPCTDCEAKTVLLRGVAARAGLQPSPEQLDFGYVTPGFSRDLSLGLKNSGVLEATIADCTISSENPGEFSIASPTGPVVVAPGGTFDLTVRFAPDALGLKQAEIRCLAPDASPLATILLRGVGGGAQLRVSPSPIEFGVQPAGATSTREFVIENVGEPVPVSILRLSLEGPGALTYSVGTESLPQDVSWIPRTFRVNLHSSLVGHHEATLVITSTDLDEPEIRVPVFASTEQYDFCSVTAVPSAVRFGPVAAGRPHLRQIDLVNTGSRDCPVWAIQLAPYGSPSFVLIDSPSGVTTLAPGAHIPVVVAYSAATPAPDEESATLRYTFPAPNADGLVRLTAQAVEAGVEFQPESLDFGAIAPNSRRRLEFILHNSGTEAVVIDRVELVADSTVDLQVITMPSPSTLTPDESARGTIEFSPRRSGIQYAEVEAWVDGHPTPARLPIRGEGTLLPCGPDCEPPLVTCPANQLVDVARPITLVGSAIDSAGHQPTCHWSLVSQPVGSSAVSTSSTPCQAQFTPDLVGAYSSQLLVVGSNGMVSQCEARIQAQSSGIWIEVFSDFAAVWSASVAPHLLAPAPQCDPRVRDSWALGQTNPCTAFECYCSGWPVTCAWDGPGGDDDPTCRCPFGVSTGPWTIELPQPVAGHEYALGLVDTGGDATVGPLVINFTVRVFCAGSLLHSEVIAKDRNQYRVTVLGTITRDTNDVCSWTPIGLRFPSSWPP